MEDPHLMRLGHYLQHLEGEQEITRLLEDEEVGMEELEKAFLEEPWKDGLSIVKVVEPTGSTKAFIEIANMKANDHQSCPFYIHTKMGEVPAKKRFAESNKGGAESVKKVVGLSLAAKEVDLPEYRPWEKKERGSKLRTIFKWKSGNPQRHATVEKVKKTHNAKAKPNKKNRVDNQCNESISAVIVKILTVNHKRKTFGKEVQKPERAHTLEAWKGPREAPSEQMQKRKVSRGSTKTALPSIETTNPEQANTLQDEPLVSPLEEEPSWESRTSSLFGYILKRLFFAVASAVCMDQELLWSQEQKIEKATTDFIKMVEDATAEAYSLCKRMLLLLAGTERNPGPPATEERAALGRQIY